MNPSRVARSRVFCSGPMISLATVALTWACASPPRPNILSQVDAVRQTQATRDAAQMAPQGFAQAEQHRLVSENQWKSGKIASSQIAAERALAGYEQTQVLARVVRAERQLAQAQHQVDESQKSLAQLEAKQKQVAAEQADLEMQMKVEQDAETLASPSPASPERELARRETARALSAQARLLCAAARLLAAPAESLDSKFSGLDTLDDQLKKARVPAPIDVAIRLRAECLHELVLVRRPKIMSQPQGTAGDELFVKLSSSHFSPSRDDRGVAVTFHDAFAANGIAPAALVELQRLGPIVKEQKATPLLVVIHGAHSNPSRDEARGKAAADVLRQLGATAIDLRSVGDQLPLLERRTPGADSRNERLEVVFVIPAN
jgi:hypothetical protein